VNRFELVATTMFGLEDVLAGELKALGATDIQIINRAVKYRAGQELMYKSNLHLRTALRVLKPIAVFRAWDESKLYAGIKKIPWEEYFTYRQTFAIDAVSFGEVFRHSKFAALKAKDAIADKFREEFGIRPSVDTARPDIQINIHIADTQVTVSLDSSGIPLGKRAYRLEQAKAPLNEVLAAGLILLSGWDRKSTLIDPMCGSGTIAIEAGMMAANMAPGRLRPFGFQSWNDYDEALWKKIKDDAESQVKVPECKISARDNDPKALEIAGKNARRAGLARIIKFRDHDFFTPFPEEGPGTLIMNPPYGERLEDAARMIPFYKDIGTQLKHNFDGWDAWIISSNLEAMKFIGLRTSKKIKVFNGALECRFNKYELYRGSRKGDGEGH